ncbi:hypothetical protein GCM10009856_55030 [Mycolicibacterium llatzerense]
MSMAPVVTNGLDTAVSPTGQWIATLLTFGLAVSVLAWTIVVCRRDRQWWPMFVLASGTATCLMEPLFDHLYGLWFREQGQWNLYTTFGSHQPVWVPAAYLSFYGGQRYSSRGWSRGPQPDEQCGRCTRRSS